jgi:hypothetical protein
LNDVDEDVGVGGAGGLAHGGDVGEILHVSHEAQSAEWRNQWMTVFPWIQFTNFEWDKFGFWRFYIHSTDRQRVVEIEYKAA